MPRYEINIGGEPVEKGDDQDIVEIGQKPTVDGNQSNEQAPEVMPGLKEVPFDDKNEKPEVNIADVEDLLEEIRKEEEDEDKRGQQIDDILNRN